MSSIDGLWNHFRVLINKVKEFLNASLDVISLDDTGDCDSAKVDSFKTFTQMRLGKTIAFWF